MAVTGSEFFDFVIGFGVSLIASVMNAAGLNLLKLDHVKNSALSTERQRNECGRPMWHVGLYLYIISQLAGSTIALNFLKTQWVAPLGSIALIFNFIFAKILVGTQITRKDVYGTIVVMISVVWIVVFGAMNSASDIEEKMTLADLKDLFSRIVFVIYFSVLNTIIFAFLALGMYAYWAISLDDESGQLRKNMKTKLTKLLGTNRFARASGLTLEGDEGLEAEARDQRLKKVVAMIMSSCGGLLASETLLLAKSGVKLITSTLAGNNQFTDYLSFFILFVLVFTAILQVYCLNTGLKLYDSVLVVPTFYGFYTAFGLINSTIYLDQLGDYEPWVLLLVLVGIAVLIYGVRMLSAPKPEQPPSGDQMSPLDSVYDDEEEDSHEMGQRIKSDLNDSEDDGHENGHDARERKRQSMLQSSLNSLAMHEKKSRVDMEKQQQPRPRIDTVTARTRQESARFSSSPGIMSPSQFKAHLIGASQQASPSSTAAQFSFRDEQADKLGDIPRSSAFSSNNNDGHSARWSTGSSKIDQVFEDLNPFKALKNGNRGSVSGGNTGIASSAVTNTSSSSSVSISQPSSPMPSSGTRPGHHGRQDSFTGLPSEWDVPERKKRHSMRFDQVVRSNSASGGFASSGASSPSTTSVNSNGAAPAPTTLAASAPMPSTPTRTHPGNPKQLFASGEWIPSSSPSNGAGELFVPSPRTSRIMSSPEIQLSPMFAIVAATNETEKQKNSIQTENGSSHNDVSMGQQHLVGMVPSLPSATASFA
ncbi:hypothetical protein BCR41DRAFT_366797 [Lobosporangium transversale]|uniref:Magnesium transporter NIPA-domain-containing protein n=1 Tax=Lobosporangium transversale TaxID=64571 RepID=A0A1Y2H0Q2_9FUNG|nr:hypothetical protein BCR41DRAFT_366797 [Lobosporangium transversale]ORZ28096.1 hypothetical protein BCR41DRAFT_366797 [Lobosporangium transversale]|eukprot:XP_021885781.1 hypothetical protein BCR41DRAFT_366797 [Lobosporangium transversale]